MKKVYKIVGIGFLTALYRLVAQTPLLFIPSGEVAVAPSKWAINGTLPIAFFIFALVLYTLVVAFYAFINEYDNYTMMKYGISLCFIWVVYLLEPSEIGGDVTTEISNLIAAFAYPIVDGSAWLVMAGLMCWQFGENKKNKAAIKNTNKNINTNVNKNINKSTNNDTNRSMPTRYKPKGMMEALRVIGIPCLAFWIGRAFSYNVIHISAEWDDRPLMTLVFLVMTGMVVPACLEWLRMQIKAKKEWQKCFISGGVIFGVNLLFFHGFVPLVFSVDIFQIFIRAIVDIIAFTVGMLISHKKYLGETY